MTYRFVQVIALLGCVACVWSATDLATSECVDAELAGTQSLFPTSYIIDAGPTGRALSTSKVEFAQGFTVEYKANYKVVNVTNPAAQQVYVLYQCGTTKPVFQASDKIPASAIYMSVPLRAVSVADTTANGFLAELGLLDRVGYATQLSVAPCLQKLYRPASEKGCGRMLEGSELKAKKDTSAVFSFSLPTEANAQQTIVIGATTDPGTLSRAEWLKYVALFFNKEAEANKRFMEIATAYNTTRKAAIAAAGTPKTKVAFADASSYPVVSFSMAAYKKQFVEDAGGSLLSAADIDTAGGDAVQCGAYNFKTQAMVYGKCGKDAVATSRVVNASTAAGAKALRDILKDVDVLVDETYLVTPDSTQASVAKSYGFTASDSTTLPFLTNNKVYRLDAHVRKGVNASDPFETMPLEWFETAVVRVDLALEDFVAAITPKASPAKYSPAYLRNVASPVEIVDGSDCPLLQSCTITPQPICPYVYKDCETGALRYVTAQSRCGPTCTSALPPTTPAPATTSNSNSTTTTKAPAGNGVTAMRPLAVVFLMVVMLIEAMIQL